MNNSVKASELQVKVSSRKAKVVILGQGYVGLPLAMRASEMGFEVVGYDSDAEKIEGLKVGRSHVGDISDRELCQALNRSYLPTADIEDLEDFDIAIISVPTPLVEGRPDLSYIEQAGYDIAKYLRPGTCVILESTTYPGTTEEFLGPLMESVSGVERSEYYLGYSPERIDPGNPAHSLFNTPKIVAGATPDALTIVTAFFEALVDRVVPVESCSEGEMAKLLENTFRHVNIALVNELARYAFELEINIWKVIDAAATKPFGFMRFEPGPGVGGHCLPIDPTYLAWKVHEHLGHAFRFVELANDINDHMPEYVVGRIIRMLNDEQRSLKGSKVLLLGLAYKAGTGDWRESPSASVADQLIEMGAVVSVCDPHVDEKSAGSYGNLLVPFGENVVSEADLVVVLVGHEEFDVEFLASKASLIFDTKNVLCDLSFKGETL